MGSSICNFTARLAVGVLLLAMQAEANANEDRTPALVHAIEDAGTLTHEEFLTLLVSAPAVDRALLLKGLTSADSNVRRISAIQLGNSSPKQIDKTLVEGLLRAAGDEDEATSSHAIISIIKIGQTSPEQLLPFIGDKTIVRKFHYNSASANADRTIAIAVSDLAITGLYYGRNISLDKIVEAYYNSIDHKAIVTEPSSSTDQGESSDHIFFDSSSKPGTPIYFAKALSALLQRSPNAHAPLITRLLSTKEPALRRIAYMAAAKLTPASNELIDRLASIVRYGPEKEDRTGAASALSAQGALARHRLFAISGDTDPKARAAAISALLTGADCSSPLVTLALTDPDKTVREAGVSAMLYYARGTRLWCLAQFIVDPQIEMNIREGVLRSMFIDKNSTGAYEEQASADDLFEILRPLLSNAKSELYSSAWQLLDSILERHHSSNATILQIIKERLQDRLNLNDAYLICALATFPEDLVGGADIPSLLVNTIDTDVGGCRVKALTRLNFNNISTTLVDRIVARYVHSSTLYDDDIDFLERFLPPKAFEEHWRELAANKIGTTRLQLYRIAASRGLASTELLQVFANVLSGKVADLGESHAAVSTADYEYASEAIEALAALGAQGTNVLSEFLRGAKGNLSSQLAICSEVVSIQRPIELRRKLFLELRESLFALLRNQDAQIRRCALDAMVIWTTGIEIFRTASSMVDDSDGAIRTSAHELLSGFDDYFSLYRQRNSPWWAELTAEESEAVVNEFFKHAEPHLLEDLCNLLPDIGEKLPPSFLLSVIERLLSSEERATRLNALLLVNRIGPLGTAALKNALLGLRPARLFEPELVITIAKLDPAHRKVVFPVLTDLATRYRRSQALWESVQLLGEHSFDENALADRQLDAEDKEVEVKALGALSPEYFFSSSSQRYFAAFIESKIVSTSNDYLRAIIEQIRPYEGPVPMSGHEGLSFPSFPWPPPAWSFKEVVAKNLLGDDNANLLQVSSRLVAALRAASSDYDYGLFRIPSGFVLLARLERINADGSPFPGEERWDASPIPPHSLEDYLIDLFLSPPGYFRIVAFAVTSEEPIKGQEGVELPGFNEGGKVLPDDIAQLSLSGRQVFALIYTFEKYDGGKMQPNYQGSPSGLTHLVRSGIWDALETLSVAN